MTDQNRGGARQSPRRRGQGELETQVLAVLGQAPGAATAAWVQERLGGTLAYTTVMTILTRLHAKGAAARQGRGRPPAGGPLVRVDRCRRRGRAGRVADAEGFGRRERPGSGPGPLPDQPDAG